jgi:ABC transport system ATP-binding/permease protein
MTISKTASVGTRVGQHYIELYNHGQVLKFFLTQDEHCLGRDDTWADFVIPHQDWEVISSRHAVFRREGDTYWIYDGDGQSKSSTNGIFINHTLVKPAIGFHLTQSTQLQIGQNPQNSISLTYVNPQSSNSKAIPSRFHLRLQDLQGEIIIGREPGSGYNAMELNSPLVSRHHATLLQQGHGYLLKDNSTNGTYVNKQRVNGHCLLQEGDTIQIGPFTLLFQSETLEIFDRGDQIRLDALQLVRTVKYSGKSKNILNNVSLAIEPGQLVALVGGSGAGKSTLMKTLLGISPLTSGGVFLNGDNLQRNFDLYRAQIGYVPQDDIIHENLTVVEVLTYACQLRLPPDINVQEAIERALNQVKLTHVRHGLVQKLSGGQRKRVSIAVELLANPKLFFLDEPTSGLDPGLDKKMMQLLRELADEGRTIILVTHATSNLNVCDRIAFMGAGGKLCYFGPPQEAMTYFQRNSADIEQFADVYIKFDEGNTDEQREQNIDQWYQVFNRSPDYQRYVQNAISGELKTSNTEAKHNQQTSNVNPWHQWSILCQRYWKLGLRDRFNLVLMLLTAPIGILLITLALENKDTFSKLEKLDAAQAPLALKVLFVFTCATMWVGLSSTAQAIVRESNIYLRERLVNLQLVPYIGSKLGIHSGLAILQTVLVVVAVLVGFNSPEPELISWIAGSGITTFLTLLASVSLGLMISAFVKNPTQANSTLPLLLIPQIIFSGILFKLEGLSEILSWMMLSRWSIGAYGAIVDINAMIPEQPKVPGVTMPPLPFEPSSTYDATWSNLLLNWGILCLHSLFCLGLTVWQQKRKDIL